VVSDRTAARSTGWGSVAGVVALLALSNVMTNRVLPGWAYVPWSLAMAVALLVVAVRVDGCSTGELGLARADVPRGLAWGGAVLAAVLATYLVALALPATRGLFEDDRVGDVAFVGMAYQAFVRIPLGTVVLEELAFRGVLLALLARRVSTPRAVVASSLLFGLWHVLPAIGIERTNPVLSDLFGGADDLVAVLAAVAATALAGVALCVLRLRSRSLVAPALAHVTTNSLGFVVAWTYLARR
jgi:CAAX protease family protein